MAEPIQSLSFTEDELAQIDARMSTDIALLDIRRVNQIEVADRRKKAIREDLAYLNKNRLPLLKSGAYTPEKLVAEEARLNAELVSLSNAEIVSDISMAETVRETVKLSELLKSRVNHLPIGYAGRKRRNYSHRLFRTDAGRKYVAISMQQRI